MGYIWRFESGCNSPLPTVLKHRWHIYSGRWVQVGEVKCFYRFPGGRTKINSGSKNDFFSISYSKGRSPIHSWTHQIEKTDNSLYDRLRNAFGDWTECGKSRKIRSVNGVPKNYVKWSDMLVSCEIDLWNAIKGTVFKVYKCKEVSGCHVKIYSAEELSRFEIASPKALCLHLSTSSVSSSTGLHFLLYSKRFSSITDKKTSFDSIEF